MTDTSREITLEQVPYLRYLVQFRRKKDKNKDKDIKALIDSSSKVNAIHPTYITNLGLRTMKINVSTQKVDRSHLNIFKMVIADCSVKDKLEIVRFFQEIFLLANISLEIVLGISFPIISKADIQFAERELV